MIGNDKTRFKTFKDLIEFLIEKIDLFIEFKNKNSKIINEINENCEKNLKFSLKQIEINENKNKIYFNNLKKEFEDKFTFFYKEMVKKTEELKIQNSNYSSNLIKKAEQLTNLKNEFDNFNSVIKNSLEKSKNSFEEMEKKRNNQIDNLKIQIDEFNKKIKVYEKNEKKKFEINEKFKNLFNEIDKINENINKLKENIFIDNNNNNNNNNNFDSFNFNNKTEENNENTFNNNFLNFNYFELKSNNENEKINDLNEHINLMKIKINKENENFEKILENNNKQINNNFEIII